MVKHVFYAMFIPRHNVFPQGFHCVLVLRDVRSHLNQQLVQRLAAHEYACAYFNVVQIQTGASYKRIEPHLRNSQRQH